MTTRYCGRCGAPNSPTSAFCGRCGAPLAAGTAVAAPPAAPAAAAPPDVAWPAGPAPVQAPPGAPAFASPAPGVYPAGYPTAYPVGYPAGYAPAPQAQVAREVPHKTGKPEPWAVAGGAIVAAMFLFAGLSTLLSPKPPAEACPPNCTRPPVTLPPLPPPNRYTSKTYGYSLEYANRGALSLNVQDDKSIGWTVKSFPGQFVFSAEPANNRSAQQVVDAIQRAKYPDAARLYAIPQAELGYTVGQGGVYDYTIRSGNGQSIRGRLIIIAAVKNGLAVKMEAFGIFKKSSPKDDAHPNPAQTPVVEAFNDVVNTVTWPGEPPL